MAGLDSLDGNDSMRVPPQSRLVDEVASRLRQLILTHQLPAGAKLLQSDLAERFGVSRTPLREAIRLLEYDGLVQVSNGNRTVEVVTLSEGDLRELYQLREVIDGLAARLLARRGLTPEVDQALSNCVTKIEDAVRPLRGQALFNAHLEFHTIIVENCGNSRLQSQLSLVRLTAGSLRDRSALVQVGRGISEEDADSVAAQTVRDHRQIHEALQRGDEVDAEATARRHIRGALERYTSDPLV